MRKKELHEKLFNELLERVFLKDYKTKGTMKANQDLRTAIDYVNNLNISLNRKNFKEIMLKTFENAGYSIDS